MTEDILSVANYVEAQAAVARIAAMQAANLQAAFDKRQPNFSYFDFMAESHNLDHIAGALRARAGA